MHADDGWDERARGGETGTERSDRNWLELLQELRVAQTGVQILLAFLLTLPFQQRFAQVTDAERGIYLASLLLAAGASALLIGPVAYHRAVFRLHAKGELVRAGSRMAVGGLALLALAICGAILLVCDVLLGSIATGLVTGGVALAFLSLWGVLPVLARRRAIRADSRSEVPAGARRPE